MVSVRYPQFPGTVDAGSIMDAFDSGFDRSRAERDEKMANAAFGQYVGTLYGKQPQTLASLGAQFAPQGQQAAPQGGIARAPVSQPLDPASARVDAAFSVQGQDRGDLSGNQIAGRFLKSVRDGGVTNPFALAAIAATGKRESGFSPKNAVGTWSDPSQSGQPGTAGGIMSWRGDRLSALQQFAQQRGDDPRAPSPETQGAFLVSEDPSLIQKLQAAQSPQEAQQLMNNAWKFAGYDQQGGETAARMALASEYAPQFGGGNAPSQSALESMAVGQTMPAGAPQAANPASVPSAMPAVDTASLLPPPEVMRDLFKSKDTRSLAIGLAQAAMGVRANASDPMARLNYEKAVAELANLRNPQPKTTDDMREYQLSRQQGFEGSFVDFKLAQKKAGATTITNNVGGNSSEFIKKSDEAAAKRLDEIVASGQTAPQTMSDMQQLVDLGAAIGTGKTAQATALLGPYAEALGIDIGTLEDIQAYEAITSRLAPQMRAVGSGASSDRDVALFFKSMPSLKNTQGGNEIIANTMKAVAQNKMNAAELASAAQRGEISWQEADKRIRDLPNPYDLFKQFQKETQAGKVIAPTGGESRQRARNPQTGETVEWDGSQWVPVQ